MGTFTETEKVAIRKHLGYPVFGDASPPAFGHRFMTHYGTLEYRVQHLSAPEEVVVRDYLTKLAVLETDIYGVRDNLDTSAAAVWTRNPDEAAERERLYSSWAKALAGFLGVPMGPGARGPAMSIGVVV